jgi:pyruvate/2-oxoglutarate dehydrogenase complex dihydrolipoamide dehydrogenase (E3) component
VAYTVPEVAWVGLTEAQAQGIKVKKGFFTAWPQDSSSCIMDAVIGT